MLSVILILIALSAAILIVLNWFGLIDALLEGRSYSFAPPFFAGVLGALALYFHPWPPLSQWFWVLLVADPSMCFAAIVGCIQYASKRSLGNK